MTDFWKDRKILVYVALAHHTRFISPVMEKLAEQGARVKYVIGQAERSQEITAIRLGLDFSHVFDYLTDKDADDIQANYHLLRNALSDSLKRSFLFGASPLTVIDKTLYSTASEYIGFRNLLAAEKPDLCFALHELNRWGKMFAFWAKKQGVPFITLQEGLTYGLDFGYSGHDQYATLNLVWGERVKRKMVGFDAPESKIIPVGNTHLAKELAFQKAHGVRDKKRKAYQISHRFAVLLILSASLPDPALFRPIFKAVAGNDRLCLFVKFHPACKQPRIDQWSGAVDSCLKSNRYFIHDSESTYDLISMADLCVLGQRSTTGLEAVAFGKPLVELDIPSPSAAAYSFADQGVAVKMTPERLAEALSRPTDFAGLIDPLTTVRYLKNELIDMDHAIDNVCKILEQAIRAAGTARLPLSEPCPSPDGIMKWSIVLQAPDRPDVFLTQLKALADHSENQGDYEIIILEPENPADDIRQILDSLKGDVRRIPVPKGAKATAMMNIAAEKAMGDHLILMTGPLAPFPEWLNRLDQALSRHGSARLFAARIGNTDGLIVSAGMAVDHNHTPVSAYRHVAVDFPAVLKERDVEMADLFLALNRSLFFRIGGITPQAGHYALPDICLKAGQALQEPSPVLYLPDLVLMDLSPVTPSPKADDSVYFHGRWHGRLWESEKQVYEKDGISPEDLAHARMTAALQTSPA